MNGGMTQREVIFGQADVALELDSPECCSFKLLAYL